MVSGVRSEGLTITRVAAGHGIRQEPERDHAREVEGGDDHGHAQRLADHVFVDPAGNIFGKIAQHHGRDAAGHFHVFHRAAHFTAGIV